MYPPPLCPSMMPVMTPDGELGYKIASCVTSATYIHSSLDSEMLEVSVQTYVRQSLSLTRAFSPKIGDLHHNCLGIPVFISNSPSWQLTDHQEVNLCPQSHSDSMLRQAEYVLADRQAPAASGCTEGLSVSRRIIRRLSGTCSLTRVLVVRQYWMPPEVIKSKHKKAQCPTAIGRPPLPAVANLGEYVRSSTYLLFYLNVQSLHSMHATSAG